MSQAPFPLVVGKEGLRGRLEASETTPEAARSAAVIRLEDGRQLQIPIELLMVQEDGSYFLPLSLPELEDTARFGYGTGDRPVTIPVIQEELHVRRQTVETGRVRIRKTVHEHEETVDEPLLRENVIVERVTVNLPWEGTAPAVRQEGDTLIIPVLEEVLVIEKRLMLKEEIHVRREQSTFHDPQQVMLRSEQVSVERSGPSGVPQGHPADPS